MVIIQKIPSIVEHTALQRQCNDIWIDQLFLV